MRRLALLAVLAVSACQANPSPSLAPQPSRQPTAPTAIPSIAGRVAWCPPYLASEDPGHGGDPCPSAKSATTDAVARLGYPVARIVLLPGPFDCGVVWPGSDSPPVCLGPAILPGRSMHGWVSFVGTERIAAVEMYRDIPTSTPASTPGPWTVTISDLRVPPAGWQMPGDGE